MRTRRGYEFLSGSYKSDQRSCYSDCASACAADPRCTGAKWVRKSKNCYFIDGSRSSYWQNTGKADGIKCQKPKPKTTTTTSSRSYAPTTSRSTTTTSPAAFCPQSGLSAGRRQYDIKCGKAFKGEIISRPQLKRQAPRSFVDCQARCDALGCAGLNFITATGSCELFSRIVSIESRAGTIAARVIGTASTTSSALVTTSSTTVSSTLATTASSSKSTSVTTSSSVASTSSSISSPASNTSSSLSTTASEAVTTSSLFTTLSSTISSTTSSVTTSTSTSSTMTSSTTSTTTTSSTTSITTTSSSTSTTTTSMAPQCTSFRLRISGGPYNGQYLSSGISEYYNDMNIGSEEQDASKFQLSPYRHEPTKNVLLLLDPSTRYDYYYTNTNTRPVIGAMEDTNLNDEGREPMFCTADTPPGSSTAPGSISCEWSRALEYSTFQTCDTYYEGKLVLSYGLREPDCYIVTLDSICA